MRALTRFVLDAIYIACFFTVTLGLAVGADYLVRLLTYLRVDEFVVDMVHWLARGLVAFDVIGVTIACGVALFRFVRALGQEVANDGKAR